MSSSGRRDVFQNIRTHSKIFHIVLFNDDKEVEEIEEKLKEKEMEDTRSGSGGGGGGGGSGGGSGGSGGSGRGGSKRKIRIIRENLIECRLESNHFIITI